MYEGTERECRDGWGDEVLNGLDLFSGIGGISMALAPWVRPLAYCENDRFAQSVLLSRMSLNQLPTAPIWDDITTLIPELLPRDEIDIIYGGFPCQDLSVAGLGEGLGGKRSGLFYEIIRLCRELRPRFVFLENVPAISVRGLESVCSEFTALRYDCRWTIVSAAEMGAPHERQRWFLFAHANGVRGWIKSNGQPERRLPSEFGINGEEKSLADSAGQRLQGLLGEESGYPTIAKPFRKEWYEIEPDVGRVVNGLQHRAHRIKCLGNAVVPAQAREAFARLAGLS